MNESTDWGFPKGNVAGTLRKILDPELTDHEVEAIVVCLLAHLLIEGTIDNVLYRWLKQDCPESNDVGVNARAHDSLWKSILNIGFAKKFSLVEPFFAAHFPEGAANVRKINNLRNQIFHGKAIKEARFEGQSISDEKTVENLFLCAQFTSMQLDKFEEMIDSPHALAEKWSKRLKELGEPLF
jgi:hypothetical protein